MRTRRIALATLTPLLALSLAACSGGGSEQPTAQGTDAGAPTSQAPVEYPEDQITKAGAQLKYGEPAVVRASRGGDNFVVKLTVDKVVAGAPKELNALAMRGVTSKQYLTYYITVTGELMAGKADGYNPAGNLAGMIGKNLPKQPDLAVTSFKPCPDQTFGTGAAVGDKVTSCTVEFVPRNGKGSKKINGVQFTSKGTAYDSFAGKPVVWRG